MANIHEWNANKQPKKNGPNPTWTCFVVEPLRRIRVRVAGFQSPLVTELATLQPFLDGPPDSDPWFIMCYNPWIFYPIFMDYKQYKPRIINNIVIPYMSWVISPLCVIHVHPMNRGDNSPMNLTVSPIFHDPGMPLPSPWSRWCGQSLHPLHPRPRRNQWRRYPRWTGLYHAILGGSLKYGGTKLTKPEKFENWNPQKCQGHAISDGTPMSKVLFAGACLHFKAGKLT